MASLLSILNPIPFFPSYKGPYEVGTIDLEVPVSSFIDSGLSPPCPSHSSIPTIQFRVFYPAALKGKAEGTLGGAKWVPSPRKEYVAAYCRFVGASDFMANLLSYIPRHLYYISLPAYAGHTLLESDPNSTVPSQFPVVIFSHGLGGSRNTYSYLTASLASQGAVVFCPEHRDGSGPTTFISEPKKSIFSTLRLDASSKIESDGLPSTPSSSGSDSEENDIGKSVEKLEADIKAEAAKTKSSSGGDRRRIDYIVQSHEISDETAAIRNKQLEIRLWELGALHAAVQKLNQGWTEEDVDEDIHLKPSSRNGGEKLKLLQMFKGRLHVEDPGSIVWMGHSFGAATTTQFVKSIWYHPKFKDSGELKDPLYVPSEALLKHFHPDGKIGPNSKAPTTILLDLWCLPLLGERTRALWRAPLPGPTMGILSLQFYKWKENLRGFRHVLNHKGGTFETAWFGEATNSDEEVIAVNPEAVKDEVVPQIRKLHRSTSLDITPQLPNGISQSDEHKIEDGNDIAIEDDESLALKRTKSKASQRIPGQPDRKFYYANKSAHFSQSDFGILFPRSARYFVQVDDSEGVLDLNVRAVTEFMREQGVKVTPFNEEILSDMEIFGDDPIKDWELVSLELGDEGLPKDEPMKETIDVPDSSDAGAKL